MSKDSTDLEPKCFFRCPTTQQIWSRNVLFTTKNHVVCKVWLTRLEVRHKKKKIYIYTYIDTYMWYLMYDVFQAERHSLPGHGGSHSGSTTWGKTSAVAGWSNLFLGSYLAPSQNRRGRFHPYLKGKIFQFDEPIYFQMGWFNHQLEKAIECIESLQIWFSSLDSAAFFCEEFVICKHFVAFVARRRWRWTTFCWSFWASLNHLVCSGTHATR